MAQQFDTSVPNIARVYDYWLGGKDNFAADRELAAQLTAVYPPIAQMIWDNRQFLARAVGWVARQGISQFIDLGPGLPTSPSTHEAARAVRSGTTVAYVDFDPLVVSHLDALVAKGQDGVVVMAADLRDRDAVLSAPDLAGHIDLSRPACLIMGAVLHFLDAEAAAELAASYTQILAPGSYVILTVGRGDGEVADRFFSMYRAAASMHSHSVEQFATFFEGLEIVPPGLLLAEQWQPDQQHVRPVPKRPGEVLVGVGKVPGPPHGVLAEMTIQRMDNVAIVVDDLDAAVAFFTELGLELEGKGQIEGLFADRTVGLDGVRSEIAMMRTPDGHSKLELTKYHAPAAAGAEPENPPPNTLGLHRVMFAVDDIHDTVARLRAHGAELLGEVAQYESIFLLCYLRGPAGIIVALAEQIG